MKKKSNYIVHEYICFHEHRPGQLVVTIERRLYQRGHWEYLLIVERTEPVVRRNGDVTFFECAQVFPSEDAARAAIDFTCESLLGVVVSTLAGDVVPGGVLHSEQVGAGTLRLHEFPSVLN